MRSVPGSRSEEWCLPSDDRLAQHGELSVISLAESPCDQSFALIYPSNKCT